MKKAIGIGTVLLFVVFFIFIDVDYHYASGVVKEHPFGFEKTISLYQEGEIQGSILTRGSPPMMNSFGPDTLHMGQQAQVVQLKFWWRHSRLSAPIHYVELYW
ncbi:MAG: hypothetical protein BRC25_01475 [Parcubacteria group bacterium SW_6_46_9]|nr:MAG: hypothetical protein BRC25_01475 [Parcubacteria group bacterium SW_6_46_9]